jgi:cation diffusion facilitator CzcD-associated flavoprotein CzcO
VIHSVRYLRAEKAFTKIVIFEQRSTSGGIWNYTGDQRNEDLFQVPQTDPQGKILDPLWSEIYNKTNAPKLVNGLNGAGSIASFLSPIYERLETNIPRGLMGFQDLDWPQASQLFPKHETVLKYIEDYARDVQDYVQHETQIVDIEAADNEYSGQWSVSIRDLRSDTYTKEVFDAVIVANGHFIVPYIPDISGIREWNSKYPGAISHSKYYRLPEDFSGKKVVVVGNSASGSDISTQICQHSKNPLLWSSKSDSIFKPAPSNLKRELPPIAEFLSDDIRGIRFEDGTVETDIDSIVFATGYFYSLPFLKNVKPELITDGSHVNNTYKHLFYAPRPTLSFLVLNQRVIPFPVAEAQSAVLARTYSGRLALPPQSTMLDWEKSVTEEMGNGRDFHLLQFPKDGNYINELHDWALSATPKEGLEDDGNGKKPPKWGEWEFWCRENFPAIRKAFVTFGEQRANIRTLDEVGFSFEEYQKKKAGDEGKLI